MKRKTEKFYIKLNKKVFRNFKNGQKFHVFYIEGN